MAHPKRRQSSTRRDKRRTHDKAVVPQIAKDPTTGELHLYTGLKVSCTTVVKSLSTKLLKKLKPKQNKQKVFL